MSGAELLASMLREPGLRSEFLSLIREAIAGAPSSSCTSESDTLMSATAVARLRKCRTSTVFDAIQTGQLPADRSSPGRGAGKLRHLIKRSDALAWNPRTSA